MCWFIKGRFLERSLPFVFHWQLGNFFDCRAETNTAAMNKKRHHYIPISYLKSFCDDTGKVLAIGRMTQVRP